MIVRRINKNTYIFMSEKYYRATIIVIFSNDECVVFDAGISIEDVNPVKRFVDENQSKITQLILSHGHFDHISGACAFKPQNVVAHKSFQSERSKSNYYNEDFNGHTISFSNPTVTFTESLTVLFGSNELLLLSTPGHTADSIIAIDKKGGTIFGGDTLNAIPYIRWGNILDLVSSLKLIRDLEFVSIVMGHYGEINKKKALDLINSSIRYLEKMKSLEETDIGDIIEKNYMELSLNIATKFKWEDFFEEEPMYDDFRNYLHNKNIQAILKREIERKTNY